jgi:RNA polymerase sigma factor (sigma-70 family)
MAGASMSAALRQVDRLFREGTLVALTDQELLGRFLDHGDEDAFTALVARHGSMVLRICLDVLRDPADAEDTFQATFLTLVRRAGSIRGRNCVGGWLHRVARRCALRANADARRRRRRERIAAASAPAISVSPIGASLDRAELGRALSVEIERLPEPYRNAVLLCLQEGLPQSEVAGRLRVSEGVIRGRLARAGSMLRERLTRRGVTPGQSAGTRSPITPAAWIEAVRAAARGATARRAVFAGSAGALGRLSAAVLIVACLLALATGLRRTTTPPFAPPPPDLRLPAGTPPVQQQGVTAGPPVRAKPETKFGRTIILRGKVFGPGGGPVGGARLFLVADAWADPVERGTSGVDGSYRLALPEETFRHNFDSGSASPRVQVALIAVTQGLGAGWVNLEAIPRDGKPAMQSEYAHDFHLPTDLPIAGRVVDARGRPVAGAAVAVDGIKAVIDGRWGPILASLKALDTGPLVASASNPNNWSYPMNRSAWQVIAPAATDADGRFRIVGVGSNRAIGLRVTGPGVRPIAVTVLTRDDVAEAARAFRVRYARTHEVFDPFPTIEVDAARTVAGIVRDARSGEPIPGVGVGIWTRHNGSGHSAADAHGRYRAVRSDSERSIWVYAYTYARADLSERYLGAARRFSDVNGLGEIVANFDIQRAVLGTGRVLESGTRRPIVAAPRHYCHDEGAGPLRAGFVRYFPLSSNTALRGTPTGIYFEGLPTGEALGSGAEIGGDGRFRIAVPPGPGVLLVEAKPGLPMSYDQQSPWKDRDGLHRLFPYAPLSARLKNDGAPDGDSGSLPGFAGPIPIATYHTYRVINPPADATTVDVEIAVPRAPSRLLRFVGPGGRPISGVMVSGLLAPPLPTVDLIGSEAEVLALDASKPREVIALSNDGMYYTRTFVRAADSQPRSIRLEPSGSVSGRLLDASTGRPLAGYRALFTDQFENNRVPRMAEPGTTDAEGRFAIRGLIPGLRASIAFDLPFGTGPLHRPESVQNLVLRTGETRDLGNLRVPARRP